MNVNPYIKVTAVIDPVVIFLRFFRSGLEKISQGRENLMDDMNIHASQSKQADNDSQEEKHLFLLVGKY